MIMLDAKSIEGRMQKSVDTLRKDLARVRTGLASPAMLDNVLVDYYGTKTPLPQVAAVSVPEPRSLAIKPWEKGMMQAVEKAILASDLGITPQNDGTYIRLNLPILTADRRKDLAKSVRKIGEEAKVAVRNIRRDENEHLKKSAKDANMSEDELKDELEQVQELTDKYVAVIDQILADKEKDILTV
jgi:ribosome recycling factor